MTKAFITLAVDVVAGKTQVAGYLQLDGEPSTRLCSFTGLFTDVELSTRLPEWLAELRAEAELGRFESVAESAARLGQRGG